MKSSRGMTVSEILINLAILFMVGGILLALLFPAVTSVIDSGPRAQAKNDVTQIATAVNAFETEYGHLPGQNRGDLGGKVLAALMGINTNINPRGLVFLEVNYVQKKGQSGFTNGYFVDPWGGRYQIAFANGYDGFVTNVGAGTNATNVRKRVAVWNDPELGAPGGKPSKDRRYVDSWE